MKRTSSTVGSQAQTPLPIPYAHVEAGTFAPTVASAKTRSFLDPLLIFADRLSGRGWHKFRRHGVDSEAAAPATRRRPGRRGSCGVGLDFAFGFGQAKLVGDQAGKEGVAEVGKCCRPVDVLLLCLK